MVHPEIQYPSRYPGELLVAFARDLLDACGRLDAAGRESGADVVRAGPAGRGVVWLRHPDLIRAALIDENSGVTKARGLRLAQTILGLGLLTLEEPDHAPRRKLVLPAFHHQRLRAYGATMVEAAEAETRTWTPGEPFDLAVSMGRVALAIASQTLFGVDVDRAQITSAVAQAQLAFDRAQHPLGEILQRFPTPNTLRARRARSAIDAEVYRVIGERRAEHDDGSLLDLLLAARDEDSGAGLSDDEVRDEAVTLLLAGHETTAVALGWTWPLIAAHPDVEARLHAEVDALNDLDFDSVRRLPYTRQVFAEAMRLYPPAWVIGRQAARDLDLDGVPVARGTTVLLPILHTHTDPRFWPYPERFDPDRFEPEAKSDRHKFAYLPFSAGRRGCIGEQFAWTEGVLALAAIARHWRVRPAGPLPPPVGSVTLRPSGPIPVVAERR